MVFADTAVSDRQSCMSNDKLDHRLNKDQSSRPSLDRRGIGSNRQGSLSINVGDKPECASTAGSRSLLDSYTKSDDSAMNDDGVDIRFVGKTNSKTWASHFESDDDQYDRTLTKVTKKKRKGEPMLIFFLLTSLFFDRPDERVFF